jgi:RNA polymerase sigma factor (sigma-70 family)
LVRAERNSLALMSARDLSEEAAAFERLFSSVGRKIRLGLHKILGNPADIEDVTQEACLMVWEQRHTHPIHENPEGYVWGTAKNLARQHIAKESRRGQTLSNDFEQANLIADPLTPEDLVGARLELDILKLEFSALPPLYQQVLLASMAGDGQAETARKLGINQATVSRYLSKATDRIRRAHERVTLEPESCIKKDRNVTQD